MRSTIDRAGRIVVPKALRDALSLADGSIIEFELVEGDLILRPSGVAKTIKHRNGRRVITADQPVPQMSIDEVRRALDASRK